MTATSLLLGVSDQRKRWPAESCAAARPQEERQTMSVPGPCSRQPKPLAAGVLQPEIGSFRPYRALQQFFKWWAGEEDLPDRWPASARPGSPRSSSLFSPPDNCRSWRRSARSRSFAQRRDLAVIAVLRATGIRLSELAGIVYDAEDAQRSDVDLWRREIMARGKGGKTRIVRISHQTAVTLDRYIRVRARHAQAYRLQLWLERTTGAR